MAYHTQHHTGQRILRKAKRKLGYAPVYLVLAIWTAATLFSLVWVLYTSLKTNREIFAGIWTLPKGIAL